MEKEREIVKRQEEEFIKSLLLQAAPPEMLLSTHLEAASESLRQKRKRAIEKTKLVTLSRLNPIEFEEAFSQFIKIYPGVHPDGAHADARRLAGHLKQSNAKRNRLTALKTLFYRLRDNIGLS